jgi:hypothetical protein
MTPLQKKFVYNGIIGGVLASYLFFKVATVDATTFYINSCQTLNGADGDVYVIEESFTGTDNCLVVQANNITIIGTTTTPTISGSGTFISVATDPLTGNTYGTTTIQNLNVTGFSIFINANGQADPGTGYGGNGGNISLIDVNTSGYIRASGGYSPSGTGGAGGTVTLSGTSASGYIRAFGGDSFSGTGGAGGTVTLSGTSASGYIRASGGSSSSGTGNGGAGGTVTLSGTSASGYIRAFGGSSYSGTGGAGGTVTLSEASSASGSISAYGGSSSSSGTGGAGGIVTLSGTSVSGYIRAFGGYSYSGTGNGGAGGTVTLSGTSASGYIRAFGGFSYSGTGGAGGTVTLSEASSASGNISAYGGFSSSGTGGAGGAGGAGGTVTLSEASSASGSISAYGGSSSSSGTGGAGGDIDISGTDITMFASNPTFNVVGGSGTPAGADGSITVNGSILFGSNQDEVWTGYSSSWLGTSTWSFLSNSENQGVVKGNAEFRDTAINQSGATVTGSCDIFDDSQNLGSCNPPIYHQGYFFKPGVTDDWNDPDNWFTDPDATLSLGFAPTSTNETIWLAGTTTGPTSSTTVGTIKVASSKTSGGTFGINISNVFGINPSAFSVSFFDGGFTTGIINGTAKFFSSLLGGISNIITGGGKVEGDVEFYNDTYNDIDNSGNSFWTGDATFYNGSHNDGTINTGTFNATSTNNGTTTTGIFNATSTNEGFVTTATFNDNSINLGDITDATFNDSSYNNGTTNGDATFYSGTHNEGTNTGDLRFEGDSYNTGTTTNATFVGDESENLGFVTSIKTRLYTLASAQTNLFRNFTDSAWTIIADNTFVKLLYRNLIDIFGRDENTTTTLVEQNTGFILHPALTTNITKCGVLDTASTTYILQNNITNFKYDSCFIITADNVTLDGNNKILDGLSTSTALYAIITASTTATTTGASAYQNLTVKNLTVTQFGTAIDARGRNNASGNGGNAGTVSLDDVVLNADVLADGGNGTANGGNAGDVNLLNSNLVGEQASTTISMNGGNSTSCGNGGNAGFIDSVDSDFDLLSQTAGTAEDSGCAPEAPAPTSGTTGGTRRNTGTYTTYEQRHPAPSTPSTPASTPANSGSRTPTFTPNTINQVALPVQQLKPITFTKLPTFGEDKKGSFSFLTPISNFLFAPLPKIFTDSIPPKLLAFLKTIGITKEQDLINLQKKEITLDEKSKDIPGIWSAYTKGIPTRDSKGNFTSNTNLNITSKLSGTKKDIIFQTLRVPPNTTFTLSLNSVDKRVSKGMFLNKEVTFTKTNDKLTLNLTAPKKPGTYTLTTKASPLPLIIEVTGTTNSSPNITSESKPSLWSKIKGWFGR